MIFENMENTLPKRKSTRLRYFDYASKGAYFVTICTQERRQLLSEVFLPYSQIYPQTKCQPVGEGLAPPATSPLFVPDDAVAKIQLKPCGEIAEKQLLLLEKRYPSVAIWDYVIMPDHIHAIIFLNNDTIEETNQSNAGGASPSPTSNGVETNPPNAGGANLSPTSNGIETNLPNAGGASPSPTLSEVICSFKSLTARDCKQKYGVEKIFQRSYAEHIIRDYKDYETRKAYIQQNPIRWYCKQLSKQDE